MEGARVTEQEQIEAKLAMVLAELIQVRARLAGLRAEEALRKQRPPYRRRRTDRVPATRQGGAGCGGH